MILKNRVKDAITNKLIGYERVNEKTGHWESFRTKRHTYLLGCITSEDNLIREPYVGLIDIQGNEVYLNDKAKCYYDDTYGWRAGKIIWDDSSNSFAWLGLINNEEPIMRYLSGASNLGVVKLELI